eukprot:119378-Amphidinium_carterae.1
MKLANWRHRSSSYGRQTAVPHHRSQRENSANLARPTPRSANGPARGLSAWILNGEGYKQS